MKVGLQYTCLLFAGNQLLFATILFQNKLETKKLEVTDSCDQDADYLFENWFAARNNRYNKAFTNLANISCMRIKVG